MSVEQKVGTRISDRFWPMQQALGKDRHGKMQTAEVYVDMRSGVGGGEKTIHGGDGGWNDVPPNLPSGDPGKQAAYQPPSERYRQRYTLIDWSQ